MNKIWVRYICTIVIIFMSISANAEIGVEKDVRGYLIGTFEDGHILEEYGHHGQRPIASLSKIMVTYLLFDELDSGNVSLEDQVTIGENPPKKVGSGMGLEEGDRVLLEDLLKGVLLPSANDGCIAIGEHLYGSEEALVEKMNQKAIELGLEHTHYYNATGLTEGELVNSMTMEDLFELIRYLIKNHSQVLEYTKLESMEFKGKLYHNTNPLLTTREDIIGLKTGATARAGSCLSAVKKLKSDQNVVVAIIMGTFSKWKRAEVAEKIFDWLDDNYREFEIVNKNESIEVKSEDKLFSKCTGIFPSENYFLYTQNGSVFDVKTDINWESINRGNNYYTKKVGKVDVYENGMIIKSIDLELRASEDVVKLLNKLLRF